MSVSSTHPNNCCISLMFVESLILDYETSHFMIRSRVLDSHTFIITPGRHTWAAHLKNGVKGRVVLVRDHPGMAKRESLCTFVVRRPQRALWPSVTSACTRTARSVTSLVICNLELVKYLFCNSSWIPRSAPPPSYLLPWP